MILDLGLPKLGGLEVLRSIRAASSVPVLILNARAEEVDEFLGLGLGADGYLVKPVSARKLMAHVGAVLRRYQGAKEDRRVLRVGGLEVAPYASRPLPAASAPVSSFPRVVRPWRKDINRNACGA